MNIIKMLAIASLSLSLLAGLETLSGFSLAAGEGVRLAKKKSRSKKRSRSAREKNIIREKTVKVKKGSRKTKVDFDDVGISGKRNDPLGSYIKRRGANKDFDLIKIRLRWHPEMVQSTSSLETGRAR